MSVSRACGYRTSKRLASEQLRHHEVEYRRCLEHEQRATESVAAVREVLKPRARGVLELALVELREEPPVARGDLVPVRAMLGQRPGLELKRLMESLDLHRRPGPLEARHLVRKQEIVRREARRRIERAGTSVGGELRPHRFTDDRLVRDTVLVERHGLDLRDEPERYLALRLGGELDAWRRRSRIGVETAQQESAKRGVKCAGPRRRREIGEPVQVLAAIAGEHHEV